MPHFGQFKISSSGSHDDVVMHSIELEFHILRAVFRSALLAFEQGVENCLVVTHLKDRGWGARNGRKPGRVRRACTGVEVWQERGSIEPCFVKGDRVLHARQS